MIAFIPACLIPLVLATSLHAQISPGRTFQHERDVQTGTTWEMMPRWEAGHLVHVSRNRSNGPLLDVIDRDGRRDQVLFTLKDAAQINVLDIALAKTGVIAISGSAVTSDTTSTCFLARVETYGKTPLIMRTWPYCPMAVAFKLIETTCSKHKMADYIAVQIELHCFGLDFAGCGSSGRADDIQARTSPN